MAEVKGQQRLESELERGRAICASTTRAAQQVGAVPPYTHTARRTSSFGWKVFAAATAPPAVLLQRAGLLIIRSRRGFQEDVA